MESFVIYGKLTHKTRNDSEFKFGFIINLSNLYYL